MALRLRKTDTDRKVDPEDERQELTEHLAELRVRLIRSAVYIVLGMVAMYALFHDLYRLLTAPITSALAEHAAKLPLDQRGFAGGLIFRSFVSPFFLKVKLSLITGLVVAAPLITLELWGFVMPGLTSRERRSVRLVAPFSVVLFVFGAGLAYFILPAAVHWFLSYLTDFPGAVLLQDPEDYILFLVKMILAFGLVFQLPVILMALGRFGVIRASMMTKHWKYIVVGLTTAAMIITPSNDPFSMIMMAIPLVLLFFLSIWLVRLVEPKLDATSSAVNR